MPVSPKGEPMTTLATRIPKALQRQLRLYCVERDAMVQDVVEAAIRERLAARKRRDARKGPSRPDAAPWRPRSKCPAANAGRARGVPVWGRAPEHVPRY